ncbi:MAG: ComF family protein [Zoogloeaceae bacterium]|nr:ComF family protein [Zoogloeaceae bacterium]
MSTTLDALLPPLCLLCGAPCAADGATLCAACQHDLPHLPAAHCPNCLLETPQGERCGACLAHPPHFDCAFALHRYDFPLNRLVQNLKYHARFALARRWGEQLAQASADFAADCVIPLPLHPERLKERGYNQALEIARHCARARCLPLDASSLSKCRATPPQSGLSLKARRKNLKGAFSCARDFSGQRILLIDDVLTTGATANEAARILKLHAAARVAIALVARTLRR